MKLRPVFLFSLPRTGSTLLQRMLGSHSAISTLAEPWILLPYLYSLRRKGAYTEYGHQVAVKAIEDLCLQIPGGRDSYLAEIKNLAIRIYGIVSTPGSIYFLDKTPRYHFICEDLIRLFDEGRFIFLWRNPLAVVASIVETWAGGQWRPYLYRMDLFGGLATLIDTYDRYRHNSISLRYEDMVTNPEKQVRAALEYLDLPWEIGVLEGPHPPFAGRMGDRTGVARQDTISRESLHKWRDSLASPVRKRWCRRYLGWIGQDRLSIMGYDLSELVAQLDEIPSRKATVASDLYFTAKAAAWTVVEPTIAREKISLLPDWRRIYSHS